MKREEIVEILEDIAVLLELKGENPFKIRAYQNGARTLQGLEEDLGALIEEERLGEVKGMGEALVKKVETLYRTGELEYYDKLRASVPEGLLVMLEIPGLGGKKIKRLHEELGIESVEALRTAAEDGRIAALKGFGQKSADNILRGIRNREAYTARHLWWTAERQTLPILEGLRGLEQVRRVEAAGSFRRWKETVGDLDFIVAAEEAGPVMEWFTGMEGVAEVTASGETKSSVRLEGGMQADLRVVPPRQFPFALHHFTGSKEHNVEMRQRALKRGWSLSEWGMKVVEEGKGEGGVPPPIENEEDLFAALDLAFIPPELREGMGEIAAAEKGELPGLVRFEDLRGCLHNHTTASDGRHSLEAMVRDAEERGWEYVGIADHSKASFQANGLDEERLLQQVEAIRKMNAGGSWKCRIFAGCEVDILADGSLDFDDDILEQLDYVVASIHVALGRDEAEQTRRLIAALEHPQVTMLGHPTGRLLLQREPYGVDLNKVIDAAAANEKIIELNASPYRLDLDWRHWRRAAEKGVICAINPDAHSTEGYDFLRMGAAIARKGWLGPEQVLNTWPLDRVAARLRG